MPTANRPKNKIGSLQLTKLYGQEVDFYQIKISTEKPLMELFPAFPGKNENHGLGSILFKLVGIADREAEYHEIGPGKSQFG